MKSLRAICAIERPEVVPLYLRKRQEQWPKETKLTSKSVGGCIEERELRPTRVVIDRARISSRFTINACSPTNRIEVENWKECSIVAHKGHNKDSPYFISFWKALLLAEPMHLQNLQQRLSRFPRLHHMKTVERRITWYNWFVVHTGLAMSYSSGQYLRQISWILQVNDLCSYVSRWTCSNNWTVLLKSSSDMQCCRLWSLLHIFQATKPPPSNIGTTFLKTW